MDSLARAVEAADGPWPVLAIGIIGIYLLFWKFGKDILNAVREGNQVTKEAHAETKQISESIITNHGSRNIGDAVDRLSEQVHVVTHILVGLDNRIQNLEEKE